jgi:hypothetical protein
MEALQHSLEVSNRAHYDQLVLDVKLKERSAQLHKEKMLLSACNIQTPLQRPTAHNMTFAPWHEES